MHTLSLQLATSGSELPVSEMAVPEWLPPPTAIAPALSPNSLDQAGKGTRPKLAAPLPAATTTMTPAACARWMAGLGSGTGTMSPMLMETTSAPCATAQSIAASMSPVTEPELSTTRAMTSDAPGAKEILGAFALSPQLPALRPAARLAVAVPWPKPSTGVAELAG